jgi:two-component system, NtrC family, nitrogen regulation sensor histidine kinase NtrY
MGPRRGFRFTLAARLALVTGLCAVLGVLVTIWLLRSLPQSPVLAAALAVVITAAVAIFLVQRELKPLLEILRALGGTVISYRDGDYSFGLHWDRNDELGDLVDAHNALGDVLRDQRVSLIQRELLLDTMVQNTPVAMLLVDDGGYVVFGNLAARQLLHRGRRVEGATLENLLRRAFGSLREAMARGGDGIFSVSHAAGTDAEDEIYHLSRRKFALNGRSHELLLLRHLTAELRRQEVQTWKKVIRVISHELNNSLAPLASLARSGAELVRRGQTDRLPEILKTVEDRTGHLERFIEGYARFAKLPAPRLERVDWTSFVKSLKSQMPFTVTGELPAAPAHLDAAQIQQALLNLIKNAHESGSLAQGITLSVRRSAGVVVIEVADAGSGMTDNVMSNALVPFYSTKRSGTGLGLALTREIVEAHGGRIALANRPAGGLAVTLFLPDAPLPASGPAPAP